MPLMALSAKPTKVCLLKASLTLKCFKISQVKAGKIPIVRKSQLTAHYGF